MSDFEQLLLVLGAIYLLECIWCVGSDAVLVNTRFRRPGRLARRCDRRGPRLAGVMPFGWACLSESWPLAVSPQAVCCPVGKASGAGRCVRFDQVKSVVAVDRNILINDTVFVETTTRATAKLLAGLLRRLGACPISERPAIIRAAITAALDRRGVETQLAAIATQLVAVRVAAGALWASVFIALPLAYRTVGLPAGLWWVLPGYLLSLLTVVGLHGRLGRGAVRPSGLAWTRRTVMMALAPTTAMRAGYSAGRELLADFHPLAVVGVLCRQSTFEKLAGTMLREARYPSGVVQRQQDGTIRDSEAWFATELSGCLERAIEQAGCRPAPLVAPPEPDSDDAVAYCPRCLSQFTGVDALCVHCGDRAVLAF